jgi:hypothetical protein
MNTTELPESVDLWFNSVVSKTTETPTMKVWDEICAVLRNEPPKLLSVIATRWCELQCEHCVFQRESFARMNEQLPLIVAGLVPEMQGGTLVHEGRVFRPEHRDIFLAAKGMKRGLIDRGSYLAHEGSMPQLDHLDVSLDGPENIHNRQRRNARAYETAMRGLVRGPEFAQKVSSLFTATKINFSYALQTAKLLPERVEWHVTPVSPARPEITHLELSVEEMSIILSDLKAVNHSIRPVVFRIYELADLLKVAQVIGKSDFSELFRNASVARSTILFDLEGLKIAYYPKSLLANETLVVDSDGSYLMPGSVAFSSTELQKQFSRFGEDIAGNVVCRIREGDTVGTLYPKLMDAWQKRFEGFREEISAIHKQLT